jgi:hypothetical protein
VCDLADRLENHLSMTETDLVTAMEQTPLHGLLAVLRCVPPSPLLHLADLPVILSGLSSWMSRR